MKKVLAILLCLVMCLGSVSAFAQQFSDMEKGEPRYKAANVMNGLLVMGHVSQDRFLPDMTVSRGRATVLVVELMNMSEGVWLCNTEFSDVQESHWSSGYVARAAELGIINGFGDGTFAPDEDATYGQMIKMLVCALGYKPIAEANGGWQGGGYLYVAQMLGITAKTQNSLTDILTNDVAAVLMYNALTVDLLGDEYEYPVDGTLYEISEDENFLTKHNYQKVEGIVRTANYYGEEVMVDMVVKKTYADNPYYIDSQLVKFTTRDEDVYDFINCTVTAYVKKTDDFENDLLMVIGEE